MIPRPPDGTVEQWLDTFEDAIKQDALPREFMEKLRDLLEANISAKEKEA